MPTCRSRSLLPFANDRSPFLIDPIFNATAGEEEYRSLTKSELICEIKSAAADRSVVRRRSAMFALSTLSDQYLREYRVSEVVFLIQAGGLVCLVLDAMDDEDAEVRGAAQHALDALLFALAPEAVVCALIPTLLRYLKDGTGRRKGRSGAYSLLGQVAKRARSGSETDGDEATKALLRENLRRDFTDIVPVVEADMHDPTREVAKNAIKVMRTLAALLQNEDIIPRIAVVLTAMEQPSVNTLQEAVIVLSRTPFVAPVTSSVLAFLTPVLARSLEYPGIPQGIQRETVLVIENLVKLVIDHTEVNAFIKRLRPDIRRVNDQASSPELRVVANRALCVIEGMVGQGPNEPRTYPALPRPTEGLVRELEVRLRDTYASLGPGDAELLDLMVIYISRMVQADINVQMYDRIPLCVEPYLQEFVEENKRQCIALELQESLANHLAQRGGLQSPERHPETEAELINTTFSLGYGGKHLLSQTNLRLVRGHHYGLCGPNGAGKSTLLRSIFEGKLEGLPPGDRLRTFHVDPAHMENEIMNVLEYCTLGPRANLLDEDKIKEVLQGFGFTAGPDGTQERQLCSLSGGWQVKAAIARAMLSEADLFLLDEPTNHLDVTNVHWLQCFLRDTAITCLIVSHDPNFLDEVCTDIYAFEQGKLVHLKGNFTQAANAMPGLRRYHIGTIANNRGFRLPEPGSLSGVRSQTRCVLRMANVSYTYSEAIHQALANASISVSLSSRIAISGDNGSGKSTLLKLLTGELVPQWGKVETHPNLRIGYIRQRALQHVEMHREKTPSEYLQWRYKNRGDAEVFMMQSRVFTDQERAEMEKPLDLGHGLGPRRVEALVGRQKWKKSFQYEVKWTGLLPKHNTMVSRETLTSCGFSKLVQKFDDHETSRQALAYRVLEPQAIAEHFENIGLQAEITKHTKISNLSDGQKVKVVLAGAMWHNPHLLILDEPTNFLDCDSRVAMIDALHGFRGGVIVVSHNEEFLGALGFERFHLRCGHIISRSNAIETDGNKQERTLSGVYTVGGSATQADANPGKLSASKPSKKGLTRTQRKEKDMRRRLRDLEWLSAPVGTPRPEDTSEDENG